MNVLVFNCGSSSLKYRLIRLPEEIELASGEAQRVGPATAEKPCIHHRVGVVTKMYAREMPSHAAALSEVFALLGADPRLRPDAVGHRVAHGGPDHSQPTLIDDDVLHALDALNDLAPIHNPPAMNTIRACRQRFPKLPQVAVFDTAYHATIPEYARAYALPAELRNRAGIRKYGFHGTSHRFVAEEAARFLRRPLAEFNAVSCHLGSGGASLCAVVGGRSVDNTMGFPPLQGLVMSTRCGDLDPAIVTSLLEYAGGDAARVDDLLNKRSGLLGLTGATGDIRDILKRLKDPRMNRAAQVYFWRLRKYLGAYLVTVGAPHAIIFTDTVGETVPAARAAACAGMAAFGVKLDAALNKRVALHPADVAAPESRVRILVVRTNEELAIARETYRVMQAGRAQNQPARLSSFRQQDASTVDAPAGALAPRTPPARAGAAFFAGLPACERHYAVNAAEMNLNGVDRGGFQGLFHQRACEKIRRAFLAAGGRGPGRFVSVCLEPNPELAAVLGDRPVMVTSGATALEGLPGLHACGSLDPGIVIFLSQRLGWGPEKINGILSKQSGLSALAGESVTLPEIFQAETKHKLAREVFEYRLVQSCGAAMAALGAVDALVFSGRHASLGTHFGPLLAKRLSLFESTTPPIFWDNVLD